MYINEAKTSYGPRTHKIDTITIHHFANGATPMTAKQMVDYFVNQKNSSVNYCVGTDGSVGMSVPEYKAACTSSNKANDMRAVTIEVANDTGAPNWTISEASMSALIQLLADICVDNDIPALRWKNDKSLIGKTEEQNMTVHRWFSATLCPGPYLMGKMGYIADEVNKLLSRYNIPSETADSWATDAWIAAYRKGVIDGTRPTEPVTRQELAVVLHRLGLI